MSRSMHDACIRRAARRQFVTMVIHKPWCGAERTQRRHPTANQLRVAEQKGLPTPHTDRAAVGELHGPRSDLL